MRSDAPAPTGEPGSGREAPGAEGVAVLIPALDEEDALPGLFDSLPRKQIRHLVLVDNGSSDGTVRVARERGATVLVEPEKGYGAACLTGIRHLDDAEPAPEVLAFVDADAHREVRHLDEIVNPVLEDRADLVLGVRAGTEGRRGNVHRHARLGNRVVLELTKRLFGVEFRDLAPFRAIRFSRLLELEMDDRNWGWTLQMQIRAARRGLRILEVEVPHRTRSEGKSKISGSLAASIKVGLKMFYTLVRERLR